MAATSFTVSHGSIRIKVKLLPTVRDVHLDHQTKAKRNCNGGTVMGFFLPSQRSSRYVGTVVLPLDGKLRELVPHEITHAVIHYFNGVLSHDDEACCTAIGRLCAIVFKRIEQLGGGV